MAASIGAAEMLDEPLDEVATALGTADGFNEPLDEDAMQEIIDAEERAITDKQRRTDEEDTEPDSDAEPLGAGPRGTGPPLRVGSFEKERDLCDGGGICSLGKWRPTDRPAPQSPRLKALHGIIAAAVDKWARACRLEPTVIFDRLANGMVSSDPVPERLRDELYYQVKEVFKDSQCDAEPVATDLPMVVRGRLLRAILWEANDPDKRGTRHYYEGVRVGVGTRMPRTPAVFAKKTKWNLPQQERAADQLGTTVASVWRDNYETVKAHAELIHDQLEEHHRRGLALKLSPAEARSRFPNLTVMSLGAVAKVQEPSQPSDLRLLMDGTHGVAVNTRIKQRDQDRCPTAADVKRVQRAQGEETNRPRGLALDAQEAHRIPPIHPLDWEHLGCQSSADSEIFIYKYGVFGVSSSAYWWARLGSAIVRAIHHIATPSMRLWILLMADDMKVESTSDEPERAILWVILLLSVLGLPLAWRKIQGGDEIAWIGYAVRLSDLSLGISEARAAWATNWLNRQAENGLTCIEEYTGALGRLAFICGALEYDRPFLAPLYAFRSRQGPRGIKLLPMYVRLIMRFLAERLHRRHYYPSAAQRMRCEAFRVDAKAEGQAIGVGGWMPARDSAGRIRTELSKWFSLSLSPTEAPWAFIRGEPYRAIASLEALAAMIGLLAFGPRLDKCADATLVVPGYTDNRGNRYALTRLQSCKFPLCLLTMELAAQLELRGQRLEMAWAPRETNQEADRLANGTTDGFAAANEISLCLSSLEWLVLPALLQEGIRFEEHRRTLHAERTGQKLAKRRRKHAGLKESQPW